MRLEADIILFNSFAFNYSLDRDHGRNFLIIKKKKNISNESDYFSKDWKDSRELGFFTFTQNDVFHEFNQKQLSCEEREMGYRGVVRREPRNGANLE